MILKERTKSVTHRILESLDHRTTLSPSEKIQYDNQIKGYAGELEFDNKLKDARVPGILISDLLLSTKDTSYQIDSLLITDTRIYLYEIKNYTGSYHYKDGDIYSDSGHLIQSPVNQVERKRAYLHNLLLNNGYHIEIIAHVVYITPNFYIYSLPKTSSILFVGQLTSHFESLSSHQENKNLKLANTLIALHDASYRPTNLPNYLLTELKNGTMCSKCFSFAYTTSRQCRTCSKCGYRENSAEVIHRSIEEFRLLFPEKPVTKKGIYDWCGKDWSESRIKRVLKKHYQLHSSSRSSYYD
ncbi:Nuclease-related domain-containing protein [Alkalibacterium putridalgicola]|uniref:Nuclease-related domain-containing protein n=1 Tax=Alkalibacterium putridalgicola TaxID=426703 RepID=A0A1H7V378_9LACT|nr:nuclease-related domain-containing protein [Alkalibacterium putridalgicola]GEK89680.1 hypothetical protein APU01nite_17190 [Alkalibacterium putridalgicola]SEM03177.1 Nuclease-related domain-containing protein [Alkalibacterium putridalgicola]